MFYITRSFKFEAAHRLMYHKGKCRNIHGHNYVVDFKLKQKETNQDGMVKDFSDIRASIEPMLYCKFDHHLILNKNDTTMINLLENYTKILKFDGEPTAENMAKYFFRAKRGIPNLISVTVWENSECSATYGEE
jgi:6-pyruvoyltetrahydropterin/6-carboxytetrahydropterin synthase